MTAITFFILMMTLHVIRTTIDVNISELKYLANHLQPEECRRFVAALHFNSFNPPEALDEAESNISEDTSCLNLLLHWNSSKGEGLGKTHEMLFRRLHQIGRDDLAQWLGTTIFQELGLDLNRMLEDSFTDLTKETTESNAIFQSQSVSPPTKNTWTPVDTVCYVIILSLCATTIIIVTISLYMRCKDRKLNRSTKPKSTQGDYELMENGALSSDSESEDKFDILKDNPATKLMEK